MLFPFETVEIVWHAKEPLSKNTISRLLLLFLYMAVVLQLYHFRLRLVQSLGLICLSTS